MILRGLLVLLLCRPAPTHPLHSSSASLTDLGGGRVTLSVRIFSDDLMATAPGGDSAIATYVRQRVRILARDGQPIALAIVSIARDGDLTQVTAQGTAPGGLSGASVQHTVLWERYRDQVNLVRATLSGHTTTLVFSNGDPPKALR